MKYIIYWKIVVFSCFILNILTYAQNIWETTGGVDGGRVNTILKVDNNIFLAGYAGGGLFRSTDGGVNWYSISEQVENIGVFILQKAPNGNLYAGTTQSIFKSTDLGLTWNRVGSSFPPVGYAQDIIFDGSGNIYAANTTGGVYKSTDDGITWNQINTGINPGRYILNLDFTSNNILVAADLYSGLYISTNFGNSWTLSNNGYDINYYPRSVTSNSAGEILVASFGNGPFKSTDNGNNWVSIKGDLSLIYLNDVNQTSANELLVAIDQNIYKSTNGGINWTAITTMFNGFAYQNLYVDNNDYIYAGTVHSGIIKSTDSGNNWTNYVNGISSTLIQSLKSDASGNLFAAISGKGLYSSTNNGNTWTKITIVNNEEDTFIRTVDVIPSGGLIVYNVYNGIYITTDLSSWNSFNTGLTNQNIYLLEVSPDYYFAAGTDGKIFRTPRTSANWTEITIPVSSGYPYDVFMSSTGDLYFLFDEVILKSTNNGDNWTDVSAGVSGYKFSIAEHPNGNIYAGTNQGVYHSTNAGSSWTPETSGLNDGALSLAIHPDGSIFAGGYASAHRSDDLGSNWFPFTEGALNCEFSDLAFGKSDVLFAAIENLGVYRTTSPITSVEDNRSTSLSDYSLEQNYPNPFNPSTSIQYSIGSSQFVTLKVFDVLGKEVATLVNEEKPAGSHQVTFDARELASGIYLYRLSANSFTETKKLILIK